MRLKFRAILSQNVSHLLFGEETNTLCDYRLEKNIYIKTLWVNGDNFENEEAKIISKPEARNIWNDLVALGWDVVYRNKNYLG